MSSTTHSLTELLRSPRDVATRIREGRDLRALGAASILSIVIGSAAYGGVVGSYRGGLQIAYAALKFPMVALVTLALVAPALLGLAAALERRVALAQMATLALAATARASLVLLALAPALGLAIGMALGYQTTALVAALGFGLAGLAGIGMLWHGIGPGEGRMMLAAMSLGVYLLVSGQAAWTLRPWLVRPSSPVVLVRAPDAALVSELPRAMRSATGNYDHARSAARRAERASRASSYDVGGER